MENYRNCGKNLSIPNLETKNIWILIKNKQGNELNYLESIIALHLMNLVKRKKIASIPSELPKELKKFMEDWKVNKSQKIHLEEIPKRSLGPRPNQNQIKNQGEHSDETRELNSLLNTQKELINKDNLIREQFIQQKEKELEDINSQIEFYETETEKLENENDKLDTLVSMMKNCIVYDIPNKISRFQEKGSHIIEKQNLVIDTQEKQVHSQQEQFMVLLEEVLNETEELIHQTINNQQTFQKESEKENLIKISKIFKSNNIANQFEKLNKTNHLDSNKNQYQTEISPKEEVHMSLPNKEHIENQIKCETPGPMVVTEIQAHEIELNQTSPVTNENYLEMRRVEENINKHEESMTKLVDPFEERNSQNDITDKNTYPAQINDNSHKPNQISVSSEQKDLVKVNKTEPEIKSVERQASEELQKNDDCDNAPTKRISVGKKINIEQDFNSCEEDVPEQVNVMENKILTESNDSSDFGKEDSNKAIDLDGPEKKLNLEEPEIVKVQEPTVNEIKDNLKDPFEIANETRDETLDHN